MGYFPLSRLVGYLAFGSSCAAVACASTGTAGTGGESGNNVADGGGFGGLDSGILDDAMLGGNGGCSAGATGCPCTSPGATEACWTGPPSNRHVGACKDGTQTCQRQGEFSTWGPCVGEVLQCGVDAAPPNPTSDSCRNLAMAFIPLQFPATVCLL